MNECLLAMFLAVLPLPYVEFLAVSDLVTSQVSLSGHICVSLGLSGSMSLSVTAVHSFTEHLLYAKPLVYWVSFPYSK